MLRAVVFLLLLALVPSGTAVAAADSAVPWRWPVDSPRAIVNGFIAPATPYGAGHRGIDIRAPSGAVYSPADGIVHFSGFVVDRPVLSIRHEDGVISSYEPVVAVVATGERVARGQLVGTVLTGHCPEVCLHLGVRVYGQYVSPLNWLGGIPPSVLLPTRY